MVGACIGFVGIIGVRVLVLGDSFDGLHSKFAETGMLETVGVSLLAILILDERHPHEDGRHRQ